MRVAVIRLLKMILGKPLQKEMITMKPLTPGWGKFILTTWSQTLVLMR